MKFQKPKVVRDYSNAIFESAIVIAKFLGGNVVGSTEHLPQIWNDLKGGLEDNPENMAWTFLASCVSTALITLLHDPRVRCELTEQELGDHVEALVGALPDNGEIKESHLINLALAPHTRDCVQKATELIAQAAPEADVDRDLKQEYREALARSVTAVYEKQPDLFRGIIEALTGATSQREKREIAWQRHGAWCLDLFHKTPIFSPDDDIDISLSQVYQKLRCYWNEEREGESTHQQYRTATVSDLHETIVTWLDNFKLSDDKYPDAIRLIAGGPGSGKSSFAKALAAELTERRTFRVLFVPLHKIQATDNKTLREVLGGHLISRHGYRVPNLCEGFPENPLDWHGEDTHSLLMIFDGLDELTTNRDRERDLAKKFVSNLKLLLSELNGEERSAAAIVLGRDLAMKAALEDGDLSLNNLIHVAPIREMTRDDLQLDKFSLDDDLFRGFDPVIDPRGLMYNDTRKAYWEKWCRVNGTPQYEVPPAIHDEQMSELNVEPLLLHLLIISDFCGDRWNEAIDNRNLVYEDIFRKVFIRNKKKKLDAYKRLDEVHFFELMEIFGLAAFRRNGRTGDHEEFERLRERYTSSKTNKRMYSGLDGADLKNVALMTHSRQEIEGAGFEFVHKSFGEYLAARALLGAADGLQLSWHHDNSSEDEMQLAKRWVKLVGSGELSNSVLRFLRDECRLWEAVHLKDTLTALTAIFDKTLANGFPVHLVDELSGPTTYRHLERRQKCAERAMLATITSLWLARNRNNDIGNIPSIVLHQFETSHEAAWEMIDRLCSSRDRVSISNVPLSGISFEGSDLSGACIPRANLSRANLNKANLNNANLTMADLSGADLSGADLSGADLSGADLSGADLSGADLSLAVLRMTCLDGADLTGADLRRVIMRGATLIGTDLSEANLRAADLTSSDLSEAILNTDLSSCCIEAASLWSADFSESEELTQEMVNSLFGVKNGAGKTLLPEDLSYPEHWYNTSSVSKAAERTAYDKARIAWGVECHATMTL